MSPLNLSTISLTPRQWTLIVQTLYDRTEADTMCCRDSAPDVDRDHLQRVQLTRELATLTGRYPESWGAGTDYLEPSDS